MARLHTLCCVSVRKGILSVVKAGWNTSICAALQVPLFQVSTDAAGQRQVVGVEPIFNSRLNPGNNLLVRINVSRYWKYYVVRDLNPNTIHPTQRPAGLHQHMALLVVLCGVCF